MKRHAIFFMLFLSLGFFLQHTNASQQQTVRLEIFLVNEEQENNGNDSESDLIAYHTHAHLNHVITACMQSECIPWIKNKPMNLFSSIHTTKEQQTDTMISKVAVTQLGGGIPILNAIVANKDFSARIASDHPIPVGLIVSLTLGLVGAFSYFVLINYRLHRDQANREHKYQEILSGLTNHDFFIAYQPIVDIKRKRVTHLEALIRWKHPNLGLLSPNQFLPDVNECKLMFVLFQYTFLQLLQDCLDSFHSLPEFQHEAFGLCINITYSVLTNPEFIPFVEEQLHNRNLPGSLFCFEVTEQMLHENVTLFNQQLTLLRHIGCHVAMDDFGMEYSSLLSLKQSDYDIYKIDKYFIDDIIDDLTCQSIAQAIIAIGHILHKPVIAEGVEHAHQLNRLYEMECHLIQGYYFSRPLDKPTLLNSLPDLMERLNHEVPYAENT